MTSGKSFAAPERFGEAATDIVMPVRPGLAALPLQKLEELVD
ncbi:MAG: hypothetical protein M0001_12870 [Treponema sp.]|nr:hypothetical protein [Treponema sp.]